MPSEPDTYPQEEGAGLSGGHSNSEQSWIREGRGGGRNRIGKQNEDDAERERERIGRETHATMKRPQSRWRVFGTHVSGVHPPPVASPQRVFVRGEEMLIGRQE